MLKNKEHIQATNHVSGLTASWKLWRHCCCRYGWYPLIVAPVVTASCLLDLYSSYDCEFINVEVGFTPLNPAWNESKATFGLFQFQSGVFDENKDIRFWEEVVEGCNSYSQDFEVAFVDGDRTWQVTRVMAFISGGSSITAALVSWLLVVLPLPASFFWPGILLPSLLISFLSQGSKFLLLDTAICQSSLWYPTGVDSLPQKAHTCSLGKTSIFCIAAAVSLCVSLLLVCLNSPQRRKLDENYGESLPCVSGISGTNMSTSLDEDNDEIVHADQRRNKLSTKSVLQSSENSRRKNHGESTNNEKLPVSFGDGTPKESNICDIDNHLQLRESGEKDIERGCATLKGDDADMLPHGSMNKAEENSQDQVTQPTSLCKDNPEDSGQPATNILSPPKSPIRIVSQVRLSKAETMEIETHNDSSLIEKCVKDLKKSFQRDG